MRKEEEPCEFCPSVGTKLSDCQQYLVCKKCFKRLKKEKRSAKNTVVRSRRI